MAGRKYVYDWESYRDGRWLEIDIPERDLKRVIGTLRTKRYFVDWWDLYLDWKLVDRYVPHREGESEPEPRVKMQFRFTEEPADKREGNDLGAVPVE